MAGKSSKREDRKAIKYFSDVNAAKKGEKASVPFVKTLRADHIPASHAVPAREKITQRLNFKLYVGLMIAILLLILVWYVLAGAGRPLLEQQLVNLMPTATNTVLAMKPTSSPIAIISKDASSTPILSPTVLPTHTPYPTNTVRPTSSPTITRTATQISILPTFAPSQTPSPEPVCREATTITLADVGKTLCVQGIIIETIEKPNNFMVIFSNQKGAFYWVSYDMVWSSADLHTCYQLEGTVRQLGGNPIMLFDYNNLPEECP
jgi:hypothetical protein